MNDSYRPGMLRTLVHRLSLLVPASLVRRIQRLVAVNPRARAVVRRLTAPMRSGPLPISAGPARGLRMDVAGSRPSYLLGTAEPEVVDFLIAHVRPGDTVYDVGANVGYFTLIAAQLVGPQGRVVAFEPLPQNAAALRRNVELNGLDHVVVAEAAVSARNGTAVLSVGDSDQEATLLGGRTAGTVTVATTTLDAALERWGAPAVLKVDIEGAEHEALPAATAVLARRPALLCEVHRFEQGDGLRLEAALAGHGYATRWVGDPDQWTSHLVATAERVP